MHVWFSPTVETHAPRLNVDSKSPLGVSACFVLWLTSKLHLHADSKTLPLWVCEGSVLPHSPLIKLVGCHSRLWGHTKDRPRFAVFSLKAGLFFAPMWHKEHWHAESARENTCSFYTFSPLLTTSVGVCSQTGGGGVSQTHISQSTKLELKKFAFVYTVCNNNFSPFPLLYRLWQLGIVHHMVIAVISVWWAFVTALIEPPQSENLNIPQNRDMYIVTVWYRGWQAFRLVQQKLKKNFSVNF